MKKYDIPRLEISYFETDSILTTSLTNAAQAGNSGGGATVTTSVDMLFK